MIQLRFAGMTEISLPIQNNVVHRRSANKKSLSATPKRVNPRPNKLWSRDDIVDVLLPVTHQSRDDRAVPISVTNQSRLDALHKRHYPQLYLSATGSRVPATLLDVPRCLDVPAIISPLLNIPSYDSSPSQYTTINKVVRTRSVF